MPAPDDALPTAYFKRLDAARFEATARVGGGWNPAEQHIAPALGLLVHAIESDRDRRGQGHLRVARVSCEILGTLPIAAVDIEVAVLRPGRTIELVEATLRHAGRAAVLMRAWLMQEYPAPALTGSAFERIAGPDALPPWSLAELWPGAFVRSVEARRAQREPGRAASWVRTDVALIEAETVSPVARMMGLVDVANGLTPRVHADQAAFPNLDLNAHLFGDPDPDWIGLDTTVAFGGNGLGLTHSVVHNRGGAIGVVSQCLTVRPR